MKFSLIIPVINEYLINSFIADLKEQLSKCSQEYEIIVVDGNKNTSIKTIESSGVIKLSSLPGRGRQMNCGAGSARGDILLFLHADTRLPARAFEAIERGLENEKISAGAFSLGIDSKNILLSFISFMTTLRARVTRIPYGDQAIFIRKTIFEDFCGFAEIPLLEDLEFMWRIRKKNHKIVILADKAITSSRRWEKNGILVTTLKNRLIIILYWLGISPAKLAEFYNLTSAGLNNKA
jgi:rSAM/selenodomain-associated transferase 2